MSESGKLDSGPENYCSKPMEFKLPNLQIAFFPPIFFLPFFVYKLPQLSKMPRKVLIPN